MGCGCANRARKLLRSRGYVLDRPGGTWRHPGGSEFTDSYVEKHHARLAARVLADRAAEAVGPRTPQSREA